MSNLKLKLIDDSFDDLENIKMINAEAFPKDEKIPIDIMLVFTKSGQGKLFAICDGDNNNATVGFTSLISGDKLTYMPFLAIDSNCRGKGYGSESLKLIKEEIGESESLFFLVESLDEDAINYEQRLARVRFYERFGFKLYDIQLNLIAGPMNIMGNDDLTTDLLYDELGIVFTNLISFAIKIKILF